MACFPVNAVAPHQDADVRAKNCPQGSVVSSIPNLRRGQGTVRSVAFVPTPVNGSSCATVQTNPSHNIFHLYINKMRNTRNPPYFHFRRYPVGASLHQDQKVSNRIITQRRSHTTATCLSLHLLYTRSDGEVSRFRCEALNMSGTQRWEPFAAHVTYVCVFGDRFVSNAAFTDKSIAAATTLALSRYQWPRLLCDNAD